MEVRTLSAIPSVARSASSRPTFLPRTCSTDVLALSIRKENIRASIHLLSPALDFPAQPRQGLEINIVINHYQEVDVFRILFVSRNRTKKRNTANSGDFVTA